MPSGGTVQLPSVEELISAVQRCRTSKNLADARRVHVRTHEFGLETNEFVGNYVVQMLVECDSMTDAQQVFDRLHFQNEHSWSSLISGYVEHGQTHRALWLYNVMQESSVYPSCYTLMTLLKAYTQMNDIQRGHEIHAHVVNTGGDGDIFFGSSLVNMYAKCGLTMEAQQVFSCLPSRNIISWTALIAGYADQGASKEALQCFEQMQSDGFSLDATTLVCLFKACGILGCMHTSREMHVKSVLIGLERDSFIGNSLVDMYCKCGCIVDAREVSDKLSARNILSWTSLIAGYAEHGPVEEALKCFEKMKLEEINPDAVTFASVLKACGSIGAIRTGTDIYKDIPNDDIEQQHLVGNAVVEMYIKSGLLEEASEAFKQIQRLDVAPWNILIAGYVEQGHCQKALEYVKHMQCEGISLDSGIYVSILKACGSVGSLEMCLELHTDILNKGFDIDTSVGNTLVDVYSKHTAIEEAHQVFKSLPVQDVVSWTALISGYAELECGRDALSCFETMNRDGVSPNSISFVCILKACATIGAIKNGQLIHVDIARKGFDTDIAVCNALIDMYGKCGSVVDAENIFEKLHVRDVISWNSMIKAYGINHQSIMAIQCFEEMKCQIRPDSVTFTCILFACSRSMLFQQGQEIFNMMKEKYGIIPTVDHYTCLVDLHAKMGCLSAVEEFLGSVSNRSLWTALLTACNIHGEIGLGKRCFQQLINMDPEQAAPYILMAKTYLSSTIWGDAPELGDFLTKWKETEI